MLPKRNLRTATLQASLAVRAKSMGSTDINIINGIGRGRTSLIKPCADKRNSDDILEKENIAPQPAKSTSFLPPVRKPSEALPPNEEQDRDWDDLDAEDEGDPLMVAEYASEIFQYMMSLEVIAISLQFALLFIVFLEKYST